jgi:hypothetical protein
LCCLSLSLMIYGFWLPLWYAQSFLTEVLANMNPIQNKYMGARTNRKQLLRGNRREHYNTELKNVMIYGFWLPLWYAQSFLTEVLVCTCATSSFNLCHARKILFDVKVWLSNDTNIIWYGNRVWTSVYVNINTNMNPIQNKYMGASNFLISLKSGHDLSYNGVFTRW